MNMPSEANNPIRRRSGLSSQLSTKLYGDSLDLSSPPVDELREKKEKKEKNEQVAPLPNSHRFKEMLAKFTRKLPEPVIDVKP